MAKRAATAAGSASRGLGQVFPVSRHEPFLVGKRCDEVRDGSRGRTEVQRRNWMGGQHPVLHGQKANCRTKERRRLAKRQSKSVCFADRDPVRLCTARGCDRATASNSQTGLHRRLPCAPQLGAKQHIRDKPPRYKNGTVNPRAASDEVRCGRRRGCALWTLRSEERNCAREQHETSGECNLLYPHRTDLLGSDRCTELLFGNHRA